MKSRHNLNQRAIEEALWLGVRFAWIGIVLLAMAYWGWANLPEQGAPGLSTGTVRWLAGAMMVIGAGCIGIAIALIVTLGRQLIVSPHGGKYRRLPLKPVARAWRDVSGLEHGVTAGRPYTRLILKPTTASREADRVSIDARSPRAAFIPVSDFNGWPDGALARDIRRFAPRIVQSTECARGEDRLDPSNA